MVAINKYWGFNERGTAWPLPTMRYFCSPLGACGYVALQGFKTPNLKGGTLSMAGHIQVRN